MFRQCWNPVEEDVSDGDDDELLSSHQPPPPPPQQFETSEADDDDHDDPQDEEEEVMETASMHDVTVDEMGDREPQNTTSSATASPTNRDDVRDEASSAHADASHPSVSTLRSSSANNRAPETQNSSVNIGQRVIIMSKLHNGKMATVLEQINKNTFKVRLLDDGTTVNKRTTSLCAIVVEEEEGSPMDGQDENVAPPCRDEGVGRPTASTVLFRVGQRVMIVKTKDAGKSAVVLEQINKITFKVELQDGTTLNKRATSLVAQNTTVEAEAERQQRSTTSEGMYCSHQQSEVAPSNGSTPSFRMGQRVKVVKTKDAGASGVVLAQINKNTFKVQLDGSGTTINKRTTSLHAVIEEENGTTSPIEEQEENETSRRAADYCGRSQTEEKAENEPARPATVESSQSLPSTMNDREAPSGGISSSTSTPWGYGDEWRVADHNRGGSWFGNRRVVGKMRLGQPTTPEKEPTFLSHILGDRMVVADVPLNNVEIGKMLDPFIKDESGCCYTLVSSTLQNDSDSNNGHSKAKCARLVYAKVSGPGFESVSMVEELLKVADFASLDPRKVVARLDLLRSPAAIFPSTKKAAIFFVKADDFALCPEHGNVGCGFVSRYYIQRLLEETPNSGYSARQAQNQADKLLGIQVRIFIPSMGLFKGMLRVVDDTADGPPVKLYPSMQKVGPSKHPNTDDRACLVVNRNGFHVNSKANEYIGRMLDPTKLKAPPLKSFQSAIRKPLSPMILRLWKGMSVPESVRNEYAQKCIQPQHRKHAYVVGLADEPCDFLPESSVFVTGLKHVETTQVFITRSPCTQVNHGRIVPIVTSKPDRMPDQIWERLNSLPFGGVIFSNPKVGRKTMPERIASGDLDGDLYLVCWDMDVIEHMQAVPMPDEPFETEETGAPVNDKAYNINEHQWFTDAQAIMANLEAEHNMSALTGKLYTLLEKVDKDSSLQHPDAIALSDAFDKALEFRKHGRPIPLPQHLCDRLPLRLRKYVTVIDSQY